MLTMPSHIIHIMCLVPDGSVLGPLPFILHMVDQADITAQYMSLCTFVDDNQLYIDCQQDDVQLPAFSSVSQPLNSGWLPVDSDFNVDKSKLMWMATKFTVTKIPDCSVDIWRCPCHDMSDAICVLGVQKINI